MVIPASGTIDDHDDYEERMTALNKRLHEALDRIERDGKASRAWRSNFARSLAELKHAAAAEERVMSVGSPGHGILQTMNNNRRRNNTMPLRPRVCSALDRVKGFVCDKPGLEQACAAVNNAFSALGCEYPPTEPPEGCSITGCEAGFYCDPVNDVCLEQKENDEMCGTNVECKSNYCDLQTQKCTIPPF